MGKQRGQRRKRARARDEAAPLLIDTSYRNKADTTSREDEFARASKAVRSMPKPVPESFVGRVIHVRKGGAVYIKDAGGTQVYVRRDLLPGDLVVREGDIVDCFVSHQATAQGQTAPYATKVNEVRPRVALEVKPRRALVGTPGLFIGRIRALKAGQYAFVTGVTGRSVFVSGHLLSDAQWDMVRVGTRVECMACEQQGETALYATALVRIGEPVQTIQAAE